jgi:hypothetical protein
MGGHFLTMSELSLSNSASSISKWLLFARVLRLREGVDSLVVVGIILLFLRSSVHDSPVVYWDSPVTVRLNVKVVDTSNNSEEALLTPVGSPRVTDSPELHAVLLAISNN